MKPLLSVCICLFSFLTSTRATTFFVNDTTTNGDVFTSSMGSDTNSGSAIAPFFTITRALQAAGTGDTIMVDAGTYIENVFINKRVVLRGAKFGQSPGSLLTRGIETILHPAVNLNTGMILHTAANNITIDGFLLDGDNPNILGGVAINGIDANVGYGVFNNGLVAEYLTVKNNIVKNFSSYGIGLFRSLGNTTGPVVPGALFTNNRVDNANRGVVLAYNAYGHITNNHISRCTGSGTWFSQQYVANLNNSPGIVSNNIIEQCPLGMQSSSLNPNASAVQYLNNTVSGNATAFAGLSLLINNTAGVQAYGNKFSNFGYGIYFNVQTAGIPVYLNYNSFESMRDFVYYSFNGNEISGVCNWLGTTNENLITPKIFGNVQFSPWLTNGTDLSAVTPGFQPADTSCNGRRKKYYVNDSIPTGDVFTTGLGSDNNIGTPSSPFYTITQAYNYGTVANDTIYVDAGTHDLGGLTYLFNKPMTLLGANYQVSPNDAGNKQLLNAARNAETIIRRVTINVGADNLTIKGFRFNTENSRVINTAAARSNFTFEKNYIYRNNTVGSLASIAFTGPASTSIGANNLQFTDNRFEANDTLFGTNMFLGGADNLTIDNNSFISSTAIPHRITSITVRPGNLKRSNNVSITNNYMLDPVSSIIVRNASNINITGNEIKGGRNGIGLFTGNDNMGSILIANNKLTDIFDPTFGNPAVLDLNADQGTTGGFTSAIIRRNIINQNVSLYGTGIPSPSQSMLLAKLGATNTGKVTIDSNSINLTGSYAGNTLAKVNGGILLAGRHTNTSVIANDLSFSATGVTSAVAEFPSVPLGIYIQTDAGALGRIGADAHINIFNNKIDGFKIPIGFYDPIDTGALYNNKKGYGHLTGGAVVNINHNSFTNDSISINNGDSSQIVNANCNWYSSDNANTVALKISPNTVRYTPFLGSGTDANAAIGFQPVPGACISLNSFLPAEGASGQVILLKGFGFTGTTSVKFNGVMAAAFSVTNDTALIATVPAGAHTGTIQVITSDASVTSANNFMVIPPTSADTIGICPGSNGVLISNISGSTYQWQMPTDSGNININNGPQFIGATNDTLRLLNIPTEWNGRQFICRVDGTNFSKNLILRVANYWTGSGGNTDWSNPLNWGCSGQVPDGNTHVTISSSVTLTAPAEAKSILVLPGNSFTVAPGVSLTIKP